MIKIVNLMGKDISIIKNGIKYEFKSEGEVICDINTVSMFNFNGILVEQEVIENIKGLPEPQENTFYIVYHAIQIAFPNRHDLLTPVNPIDEEGNDEIGFTGSSIYEFLSGLKIII